MVFLSTISFSGKLFSGFVRQPEPQKTIEISLKKALELILKSPVHLSGCSRLDAGVHAEDFLLEIRTTAIIVNLDELKIKLNGFLRSQKLPISIKEMFDTPLFHPRDSKGKWYQYQIWQGSHQPLPFLEDYCLNIPYQLNLNKMWEALEVFQGTKDFHYFRNKGCAAQNTIKTIFSFNIKRNNRHPEWVTINVLGNGFLKQMIRILIGLSLFYEKDKITLTDLKKSLLRLQPLPQKPVAQAKGLMLKHVFYQQRPQKNFEAERELLTDDLWSFVGGRDQKDATKLSIRNLTGTKPKRLASIRAEE
jgi:tRNA pseudouridine38-40 synthase